MDLNESDNGDLNNKRNLILFIYLLLFSFNGNWREVS